MANIRIAQIGQTAVNRPFFEVMVNGKKYVFATNENGTVSFRNRAWLRSLGVYSTVCDNYANDVNGEVRAALGLASDNSCTVDVRFTAITTPASFQYVLAWNPFVGWTNLIPAVSYNFVV